MKKYLNLCDEEEMIIMVAVGCCNISSLSFLSLSLSLPIVFVFHGMKELSLPQGKVVNITAYLHVLFLMPVSLSICREKQQPPSLQANKHPHGNTTTTPTHPHSGQPRPYRYGNDNSSNNRQSRSQSTRPDPVAGM